MTNVFCATIECKYNTSGECKKEAISLSGESCMTLWQGRQQFWRCKDFEMSEEAAEMFAKFDKMIKESKRSKDEG